MTEPIPGVEARAEIASSKETVSAPFGIPLERLDPCDPRVLDLPTGKPRTLRSRRSSPVLPVSSPLASGKYGTCPRRRGHAQREDVLVVAALEEVVVVLENREARRTELASDAVGLRELLRREVRAPDGAHLPRRHERIEGAERLGDRCPGIRPVHVVEVDVVRTKALERAVDRIADVLRRVGAALRPQPNLVARTTRSRRPSRISPRKRSLPPPLPYTSAVSKNVTPASSAASTTARVAARSIRPPKLLHPSPTRETRKPLAPRSTSSTATR